MNHFVVSDLHLCDGGPRDRFAWNDRPQQFDRFLDFVEQQHGRLIIAGDLFDLWQCNFSRSVEHYGPLLDRLAAMQAIYVVGNHDIDLLHFIGAHFLNHPLFDTLCGPFVLNDGRRRIKIMHGHEADKYCSNEMPDFSRILATITGLLEDKNGGPMKGRSSIEDLFVGSLEKMVAFHEWLWGKKPRDQELIAGLKQPVDNGECNIVIGGHTHTPGRQGEWYYNSGSWCTQVNSFVNITGDSVRVYDWDHGPIPNNVVLG